MKALDRTQLVGLIYNNRLIALVNELKQATKTYTKVRKSVHTQQKCLSLLQAFVHYALVSPLKCSVVSTKLLCHLSAR